MSCKKPDCKRPAKPKFAFCVAHLIAWLDTQHR